MPIPGTVPYDRLEQALAWAHKKWPHARHWKAEWTPASSQGDVIVLVQFERGGTIHSFFPTACNLLDHAVAA